MGRTCRRSTAPARSSPTSRSGSTGERTSSAGPSSSTIGFLRGRLLRRRTRRVLHGGTDSCLDGRDFGWLAVLGDARVLPEHRGLGWIDVALEKLAGVVPRSVALGLLIIKEGNRAADQVRSRFRLEGYDVRAAGRLTVWNLLLMRRRRRVP